MLESHYFQHSRRVNASTDDWCDRLSQTQMPVTRRSTGPQRSEPARAPGSAARRALARVTGISYRRDITTSLLYS